MVSFLVPGLPRREAGDASLAVDTINALWS
jgi:hypothetical protein